MTTICQNRIILFIFIIIPNLVTLVTSQQYYTFDGGHYTSNSTYRANLNTLLSSLPSNLPQSGFYNASTDVVNAIVLCRGDVQLETCRSCVYNATIDIVNLCPNQKQAYLRYELCMLRYSNESIFGTFQTDPAFWAWNRENVTHVEQFKVDMLALMDDLRVEAASGGPLKKVAAGNRTGPDFQDIYALVQCPAAVQHLPDERRQQIAEILRLENGWRNCLSYLHPSL